MQVKKRLAAMTAAADTPGSPVTLSLIRITGRG